MMKPLAILSVESLLETTIITSCFGPSVYGQARNSGQRASLVILDKKEESWQNVGVAIPEGRGQGKMRGLKNIKILPGKSERCGKQ